MIKTLRILKLIQKPFFRDNIVGDNTAQPKTIELTASSDQAKSVLIANPQIAQTAIATKQLAVKILKQLLLFILIFFL